MDERRSRWSIPLAVLVALGVCAARPVHADGPSRCQRDAPALASALHELFEHGAELASLGNLCRLLNTPFMRARKCLKDPGVQADHAAGSQALKDEYQKVLSLRVKHGCLIKCPDSNPECGDDPDDAWAWHQKLKQRIEACRQPSADPAKRSSECQDMQSIELAFRLNFLLLVRRLPTGDYRLRDGLDDVMITVDPGQAMREVLNGIATGRYTKQDFDKLVRGGLLSPMAIDFIESFLAELQQALERPDTKISQEALSELVFAALRAVQNGISGTTSKRLADALEALVSNEEVERLLRAQRILKENDGATVFRALQLLTAHNRAYLDGLTPAQRQALGEANAPNGDVLASLVQALSHVHMAELHRRTQELTRAQFIDPAYRQLRLQIVLRMPAACRAPKACEPARAFVDGVLNTVNWGRLWAIESVSVNPELDLSVLLSEATRLVQGKVTKPNCDVANFGSLCTDMPYAGVLVLDVQETAGTPSGFAASASWRTRELGGVKEQTGLPAPALPADTNDAAIQGGKFGMEILTKSGHAHPGKPQLGADDNTPAPLGERPGPSWRQWSALGALVVGGGAVIGGVYVNNTHPSDPAGDRLWQAGLGFLATALILQVWELIDG